ncbi:MAG: 23S rRNA (pseudouridine(1915)-N(3))-methyltransferase RlmH [Nanoarchaeota archaeon]
MITIIGVGALKDKNISALVQEYLKRLSSERIVVLSVKEEKATNDVDTVKKKEGERLLERIASMKDDPFVIALSEEGKNFTSVGFAEFLKKNAEKKIIFVIGGAYGLSDTVKKKAHLLLSLSSMTFPHEIAQLLLVEQIYRGWMINTGRKYQK